MCVCVCALLLVLFYLGFFISVLQIKLHLMCCITPIYIWPPSIKFDHGITSWLSVCLVVAALLVAVETEVGETISAVKVTFVCGLWSVRVVVLLSAGPSSCFCIHQLVFPCLEVLVQGASPHHAVSCKVLPGIGVDV